ncbi:hypothetical protein BDW22DRAFT_1424044 [Trametopsis cervina]|nr:hypothetical protein BDW22DRAFT_1424044 [Trametopsis cervina]
MSSSTPERSPSRLGSNVQAQPSQQLPPTNRLPSYRSSYCGRYHPYGRRVPRHGPPIDLMKTIDARCESNRASISLSVVDEEDEEELDEEEELTEPRGDSDGSHQLSVPHANKAMLVRRRSFTDLVVDLAFAMRRSLHWKRQKLKFVKDC